MQLRPRAARSSTAVSISRGSAHEALPRTASSSSSPHASSRIATELLALADAKYAIGAARFFKSDYSTGDVFIGVRVPQCRAVVRTHLAAATRVDVVALLRDPRHELRIAGGICVVEAFTTPHKHAAWLQDASISVDGGTGESEGDPGEVVAAAAPSTQELQERAVAFYLEHLACFDNWDLVDLTSYKVLGVWLVQRHLADIDRFCAQLATTDGASAPPAALTTTAHPIDVETECSQLAAAMQMLPDWYQRLLTSSDFWETRVSIVLLLGGARQQRVAFAIHICRWHLLRLVDTQAYEQRIKGVRFDDYDLVHKACGWVLRECGKSDRSALVQFLERYATLLPRTTLQYATEHLDLPSRTARSRRERARDQRTGPGTTHALSLTIFAVPPLGSVSLAQVACALLAVAFTGVAVPLVMEIRRRMRIAKALAPIPGPKGWFLLGILPDLMPNLHHRLQEFQEELMVQYGGRVNQPWNILSTNSVFLSDPEDVKHVTSTRFSNYIKTDAFIAAFSDLFGKSFFGLNHAHKGDRGAMWRLQRKVALRVFTTSNLRSFSEHIFHKYAEKMVEIVVAQGGRVNIAALSSQYALQSIFDVLCGVPLADIDDRLGLSFVESMSYIADNVAVRILQKPYFKYLWWCMPSEYRLRREAKVMMEIADAILTKLLSERPEALAERSDVMSRFIRKARELEAEGEHAGASVLDLDTLRSIFLTINSAGWDSTSSTVTYTLYTLVQYPEMQQKLYEELQTLEAGAGTFDGIKNLPYLDAVVWETMRLYPTVPLNQREAAEDDILPDGTFIPAGTTIFFSSWYMGRHNPVFGDDRDVFRPERWLEMKTRPSAYDFPVFSAGPRICPGMNMALIEAKICVATLVSRFHIALQDGEQLFNRPYVLSPTLTMKDGLPLQMTPRDARAF